MLMLVPFAAQIAFTSSANGKEPELLEPGLLPTLASMLQLSLPRPALLRALKVLKLCTGVSGPQHLPSWNLVREATGVAGLLREDCQWNHNI